MNAGLEVSATERALLETLTYSAIFQYPLTAREISERLLELRLAPDKVEQALVSSPVLGRLFERTEGYFHPLGKSEWVPLRRSREERSTGRLRENRRLLRWICSIPFTRLVALSGSAAHLNMNGGGDIDLFIVTRGRKVWTVAVAILLLSKLLGRRRWICFNFLVSDRRLALRLDDLFSANQLVHLRPLIGGETLRRLLEANPSVKRFYPNAPPPDRLPISMSPGPGLRFAKRAAEIALSLGIGQLAEAGLRFLYRRHLQSRATAWASPDEVTLGDDLLKLHTESHKKKVLETFRLAVAENLQKIGGG